MNCPVAFRRFGRTPVGAWLFLLVATSFAARPALAQEDDEPEFLPGLVATMTHSRVFGRRLDDDVAFSWGKGSPDPRYPAGKFSAQWNGRLFTIVAGEYQLHAFASGTVRIKLAGQVVLDAKADKPGWLPAKAVRLEYGHHPIQIDFERSVEDARLSLFWEGPKFQLEPIPPRNLFHEPQKTTDRGFERGQQLARALRCAACHELPGPAPIAAPSLASAGKQLDPAWLVDWLSPKPPAAESRITRRMPHFGLTRDDAEALAFFLTSEAQPTRELRIEPDPPAPKPTGKEEKKKDEEKPKKVTPSPELGATLLRTVGCLACHQSGGIGAGGLFGGGDLTNIAGKRPAGFFAGWLADPSAFNAAHRMPVFRLSSVERESLAMHLATLGKKAEKSPDAPKADAAKEKLELGRRLAVEHRCGVCHALPGKEALDPKPLAPPVKIAIRFNEANCMGPPDLAAKRPGFHLNKKDIQSLRIFLGDTAWFRGRSVADAPPPRSPAEEGAFVLAERQCLSCHARDPALGIAPHLAKVVALDGELAAQLPALVPPALNGVGDKLHEEWLLSAIESKQPLRPWLRIRMPRFALDEREKKALVDYFVSHDRIPDRPAAEPATPPADPVLQVAGSRLVTADGFGCTSCHQVGSSIPHQVALNAHGTDLSMIGKRIRPSWYDRWVRDPARIVPRMEMPSVKLPVRGVLGENLDQQLAAVWHVVNQPGFEPPLPNPIRTVRTAGLPEETRAAVVTDVVLDGKQSWVKPLVVGLPNRQNVLFDLDSARMAGWWIGDTVRQRTRGKSWHWEPGGTHVWPLESTGPELQLERDGKLLEPKKLGQFFAELDAIEHVPGGIVCAHRLQFEAKPAVELRVRQTWTASGFTRGTGGQTGFTRKVEIEGLKEGDRVLLGAAKTPDALPFGRVSISSASGSHKFEIIKDRREVRVTLKADKNGAAHADLQYFTNLPVDRYLPVDVTVKPRASVPLDVVPGYEALELPLGEQVMPTGLAWMADGTLAVCSLKGEVWLARDRDGDKIPDTWQQFSDDLATPYGIAVPPDTKGTIDVITKTALVRLVDTDSDGRADRSGILASGWGHTDDYHDWAVGLVRDDAGRYYVALPCEQDGRNEAAAHLRGKLLRLTPPAKADVSRWSIEDVCGGLRFPMGLAMNRAGDLFASDNQGNYNPFNELNHLLPGKRYGFINSFEKKQKLAPPVEEPAINIPHPWTRSVNGICFLETPAALRKREGRDLFGPFEGHLLGCEYDTQRLVRMSLEKIGDTYQGAAYPFSHDVKKGARGLEGPVVAAVAPDGDIYVGNMRDSGWGAGANVGSVVRLRAQAKLPTGIAEVRAAAKGLAVKFTNPVDVARASDTGSYSVDAYRRVSTPAYGGPDVDRHSVKVVSAKIDSDAGRVVLELESFREGFVYELRVKSLAPAGEEFFPAEAHYTLRKKPVE